MTAMRLVHAPLLIDQAEDAEEEDELEVAVVDRIRLRALVDEHFDFIWRSLQRMSVPQRDLADCVQQVFLVASRKLSSITEGSERSFLIGTALRVAADARRTIERRREVSEEGTAELLCPGPQPDEIADQRRLRALLDEVLRAMPEDLRVVFVLFELEEMPTQQIGWGVLPKSVWTHLSISRSGTSLYTHLNGVWKQTITIAAGDRLEGTGVASALTVGNFAPAYIDDLLITVGGVKHTTANFTPVQQVGIPYIYLPMDGPGDGENLSADFRNAVSGGTVLTPVGAPAISSTLAGCAGCGNFTSGSLTAALATANAIGTHPSYIDDLMITIGTARHSSANFSVYP